MQQQFYEQPRQQQEPRQQRRQRQQHAPSATFAVPRRQSFLGTVLYLLAAFPLGLLYFIFLTVAFSFGFGMLAIWVGLPILYVTMLLWLRLAAFERKHTMSLLNVYIEPTETQRLNEMSLWQSLKARITNPATWKSLAYLLTKFPFGIFSFTVTVTFLTTSIALILSPLAYLVFTILVATKAMAAGTFFNVGPYAVFIDGQFHIVSLIVMLVACVTGIALFYIFRIILNFIAYLWGEFARVMLSRHIMPQPIEAREFAGQPLE